MTKTNDDNDACSQRAWMGDHAAGVASPNQAAVEVHADKLAVTQGYNKSVVHPVVRVTVAED